MTKTESKLLPFTNDQLNSSVDLYDKPVYECTLQMPIRPPTRRRTKMFMSRTYNQFLSTICFVLFIIGFFCLCSRMAKWTLKKFKNTQICYFLKLELNQDVRACLVKKSTDFWSIYKKNSGVCFNQYIKHEICLKCHFNIFQ